MLKYSKGQKISLNLTLVNDDGQLEDSATVNYKIYNDTNTLELSGNNLSFDEGINGYVEIIDPSVDWLTQEEGVYYVKWEISNTSNKYPESATEEMYIELYNDKLNRILGLVHENMAIDNPIYDKFDNLKEARLRIYSDGDSVGTDNNVIGEYQIFADTTNVGKFNLWQQKKID